MCLVGGDRNLVFRGTGKPEEAQPNRYRYMQMDEAYFFAKWCRQHARWTHSFNHHYTVGNEREEASLLADALNRVAAFVDKVKAEGGPRGIKIKVS